MLVVYERDMLPDMPLFLYVWWWSSLFRHVWGTWVFNIKNIQFGDLIPAMWDSFRELLFPNKFINMRWKFVYEEAWTNYRAFLDRGEIVHIKKI